MTPAGSHHVTWERCPRCGLPAAVGWRTATGPQLPGAAVDYPVEFDCVNGCPLTVDDLATSFPSSVTTSHRPSRGPGGDPGITPPERIAALELVPGHATTVAEVWLWHGSAPGADGPPRPWVSLKADDWPMAPATARRLAAALVAAAERAEG